MVDSKKQLMGLNQKQITDLSAASLMILVVATMIVSVPPMLLSLLMVINICISLIILLISFYIREPLEFSTFPSILLVVTIFRLALNVASTKLILGAAGPGRTMDKAGPVIRFFGQVVAQDDAVIGFVVFLILVVIQFVVITKGAGRIAEVAARFTLDAMPGKQMSIDADLNAGLIDENEARRRRANISREADFYGAMDGSSKFVRGDAIAGLIISAINIIGGILVGFFRDKMGSISEILTTYTILTIGDGLVTQIPALLVSVAAGMLVTRASQERSLGQSLSGQIFAQPGAFLISGAALSVMAMVSLAIPEARAVFFPFLVIGTVGIGIYWQLTRLESKRQAEVIKKESQEREKQREPEPVENLLQIDSMGIDIGYSLISIVDTEQGGDLLERVGMIRRQTALELGLVVPPIRIRDNMQISPNSYVIKIRGTKVASGELLPDHYLAMNPGEVSEEINGIDTVEPAFGLPARWIEAKDREKAEMAGYSVIEPAAVLATHLTEVIRANAYEILGRQEVQSLVDNLRQNNPVVVEELIGNNKMSLGAVQKVLQNLLRERIPIRNLVTIFETLADHAPQIQDIDILTEIVRSSLARIITQKYTGRDSSIAAITLDPQLENVVTNALKSTERGTYLALDPNMSRNIVNRIREEKERANAHGYQPVLLTNPQIRPYLQRLVSRFIPGNFPVLSFNEITTDATVRNVAVVRL